MCFPLFCGVLSYLPWFWLVTMPLYGSFCGTSVVLRLSLLMIVHTLIGSLLSKVIDILVPFLQLFLLGLLISLPVTLFPDWLIWIYDASLWVTEPVWLLMEAMVIVAFTMKISQNLVSRIDVYPLVTKASVLCLAGLCYVFSCMLILNLVEDERFPIALWIWLILLVAIVTIHVLMWTLIDGILSDAAFLSFCCVVIVYMSRENILDMRQPLKPPDMWNSHLTEISFIRLLVSLTGSSLENVTKALGFLRKMFSPLFLLFAGVRVCSVITAVTLLCRNPSTEEDTVFDEDKPDGPVSTVIKFPWKSPLVVKLAVIFVYTQMVTGHLYSWTIESDTWRTSWGALCSAALQITCLLSMYSHRLFTMANNND